MKSMDDLNKESIRAELVGRDVLELRPQGDQYEFHFTVCSEVFDLLQQMKMDHGVDLRQWPIPTGGSHGELLLKELLLKLKGQWCFPYESDELCHCRNVMTTTVDQAVIAGAHTPEIVSRWTIASTGCGTCRRDVEKVIAYRLGS